MWKAVEVESAKLKVRIAKLLKSRLLTLTKAGGMEPIWEWIPTEDRVWDNSDTNTCKSGRDWPVAEDDDEGKNNSDGGGNSASFLGLSLPLVLLSLLK